MKNLHEVSIVNDLMEIIQQNVVSHSLKKVTKVTLKIGTMTSVEEHALRFAFEVVSKDTEVEGAELKIETVEATALCPQCEKTFNITFLNKICPICNAYSNNIVTGYELLIDEMEGE